MWEQITSSTDATIYFVMAVASTLVFLVRLVLAMAGGDSGGAHGGDFEIHTDLGTDAAGVGGDHPGEHHTDSTAAFKLLSLLSVLAFFMGAGWMGLACRVDWQLSTGTSILAAFGFGFVCMLLTAALARSMRSLNTEPTYDLGTCVGMVAQVYLPIPPRGAGHGQVRVSVDGRSRIVGAGSTGPAIPVFSSVKVVSVQSDDTVLVEPQV